MQLVRKAPFGTAGDRDERDAVLIPGDDLELVARAKADPAAFALLYERYRQAIYVYCFRRLGTPEIADDATSGVFMKAFTALPRFRPDQARAGSTFRSWLFAIAHNVVIDLHRRNRHHVPLDTDREGRIAPQLVDAAPSPEDAVLGAEEARTVVALLAQLPERQRAAVELRLAGLSTVEVAHTLGMSVPAAKSMQFRAYRALRDLLRANPHAITRELPR